ncbi:hypothetical protein GDO81_008407 [Engystomops pustulosus]|uniref:Endonuclease/exonuclease/phosphatase domain-containing protein n=1 Tax=Engystomops pustulosus TaxID=76066 RepID=A0AAV7CEE8_ENGPU|nr:hypothetical protein GDO81_008407 [Engystomops pustulosus]
MERLTGLPDVPLLIMGDFNPVFDESVDSLMTVDRGGSRFTLLGRWCVEVGLHDLWWERNVWVCQYSCASSTYSSLSRIDMILG